jgi:predicted protein tyrosine phosphatase
MPFNAAGALVGIPDEYGYVDQDLIDVLRERVAQHLTA